MKVASKAKPTIWDRIDTARKRAGIVEDDVPAEAFTINQYAQRYGVPQKTAFNHLSGLVDAGVLKTGKKLDGRAGRRYLVRFYWPV